MLFCFFNRLTFIFFALPFSVFLSMFKQLITIKTENMKGLTYTKKEGMSCSRTSRFPSWAAGSHVPPPDLSASSSVCFPFRSGDRFGQGRQRSIFSTWKLGMNERGNSRLVLPRFLETAKQARGPTVRERGRERAHRDRSLWPADKEYLCMSRHVHLTPCPCVFACFSKGA